MKTHEDNHYSAEAAADIREAVVEARNTTDAEDEEDEVPEGCCVNCRRPATSYYITGGNLGRDRVCNIDCHDEYFGIEGREYEDPRF